MLILYWGITYIIIFSPSGLMFLKKFHPPWNIVFLYECVCVCMLPPRSFVPYLRPPQAVNCWRYVHLNVRKRQRVWCLASLNENSLSICQLSLFFDKSLNYSIVWKKIKLQLTPHLILLLFFFFYVCNFTPYTIYL